MTPSPSPSSLRVLTWPQTLGRELLAIWIMVLIAACVGLALNQFHDTPLPLVYAPKAERLQQVVEKMIAETSELARAGAPPHTRDATKDTTPPADFPPPSDTVRDIDLATVQKIAEGKASGILLDARPEIFHRLGHIPRAISLPREAFEADYAKNRPLLEADKAQRIVVYCSGASCEDSQMVADALVKLSYTRVFVFRGGWSDWTAEHLPEEKTR